jgi:GTP-sensing pleiotropic transcriptional regulator CodY
VSDVTAAKNMLEKIRDAAKEGQDGSSSYALDRLALIRQLAVMALRKLETK